MNTENQTLEAFAAASCLYAKLDCPVAHQKLPLLATAHDCENGLLTLSDVASMAYVVITDLSRGHHNVKSRYRGIAQRLVMLLGRNKKTFKHENVISQERNCIVLPNKMAV